jgi:hypothetical protein
MSTRVDFDVPGYRPNLSKLNTNTQQEMHLQPYRVYKNRVTRRSKTTSLNCPFMVNKQFAY